MFLLELDMDNVENIVIEHLKRIQAEQAAARERDAEIINRLGRMELALAGLRRDQAHYDETGAEQSLRLDRLSERIDRIERRLEIQS